MTESIDTYWLLHVRQASWGLPGALGAALWADRGALCVGMLNGSQFPKISAAGGQSSVAT
jgi:hypothetical protein